MGHDTHTFTSRSNLVQLMFLRGKQRIQRKLMQIWAEHETPHRPELRIKVGTLELPLLNDASVFGEIKLFIG